LADNNAISIRGLQKSFGNVNAVENLDLDIASGEFFSMLGPSGSGKTTVLRLIAGFEKPTAGTIALFGQDVTANAPFDRDVNTVFQDYALFPHMNVLENVGYGLRVRGMHKGERNKLALEALETVRLGHLAERKPSELSGGQRQRVALARAIAVKPKVLLLDEPLGALDLKLREQMQIELKELQRELGITFIFVTHDQEEALSLSDRVAVFNAGRIEQLGTPRELYENPASEFVAKFVGTTNLLEPEQSEALFGQPVRASLRPEKIRIVETGGRIARVLEVSYLGVAQRILVETDGGIRLNVLVTAEDQVFAREQVVHLQMSATDLVALEPNKEKK
jgi:putative spermidine/putrescine transport system ATP-binding protein